MKKVMLGITVCATCFSADADENIILDSYLTSIYDCVYAGLGAGVGFLHSEPKEFPKVKSNTFVGTALIGAGKAIKGTHYVGGEFIFDFMKDKTQRSEDKTFTMDGFRPQIALKGGEVLSNDHLVYGKFGLVHSKVSQVCAEPGSKDQWSPTLCIGAEKTQTNKLSIALEAEHSFGFKWRDARCNKGWSVRALFKYNVQY